MVAPLRALSSGAPTGETSGDASPSAGSGNVQLAAALPPPPRARVAMPHPAFAPLPGAGVATRSTRIQRIAAPVIEPPADHPELSSSVLNRFLGLARHEVTASSEATLNDDETRRLHVLLGDRAHLDPKTVPPSFDDQRLLQRLLNITLSEVLNSPLTVDGNIGGATKAALQLYRRARGLPATAAAGALVDRDMLVRLGHEAVGAYVVPNRRVPRADADATPAVRSVTGMLDILSREDPVRYSELLRAVGVTNVSGRLGPADLQKVISAASRDGRRLVFDDDTATRLQLSQPGFGPALPWSFEAARIVADVFSGGLQNNRSIAGLGRYRGWARQAEYSGLVLPRVAELDALVESEYNPRLVSSARARGLHQLTSDVTERYGSGDPFVPLVNIGMARRELARVYDEQLRRLRSNDDGYARRYPDEASMPQRDTDRIDGSVWRMAWAANNAGPRRLLRYQGVPPFDETQRHIQLMAWYNATLPSETEVPPSVIPSFGPKSTGPQGPEDYGIKTVIKEL